MSGVRRSTRKKSENVEVSEKTDIVNMLFSAASTTSKKKKTGNYKKKKIDDDTSSLLVPAVAYATGSSSSSTTLWKKTIDVMDAQYRIANPFWEVKDWPAKELAIIPASIKQYVSSDEFHSNCEKYTRVFYLKPYFDQAERSVQTYSHVLARPNATLDWIRRLIVRVPFIYVNNGEMQNGITFSSWKSAELKKQADKYDLLTNDERILSRRKAICSVSRVLAKGGYPKNTNKKITIYKKPLLCIMISVLGPQMDVPVLDAKYFIRKDPNCKHYFDKDLYFASVKHDVYLWLHSFNEMVKLQRDGRKGLLKLCRIGAGFFAQIREMDLNVGDDVAECILYAVAYNLSHFQFAHLQVVELMWFDTAKWFESKNRIIFHGIELRSTRTDVLDFDSDDVAEFHIGITNASDSFSCVGNEMGYESLEAYLGNNTTMRADQVYHWNSHLLESKNYKSVELPGDDFGSILFACNGQAVSKLEDQSTYKRYVHRILEQRDIVHLDAHIVEVLMKAKKEKTGGGDWIYGKFVNNIKHIFAEALISHDGRLEGLEVVPLTLMKKVFDSSTTIYSGVRLAWSKWFIYNNPTVNAEYITEANTRTQWVP